VRFLEGTKHYKLHVDQGYIVDKTIQLIGSGRESTIFNTHNRLDHQDVFHLSANGCTVRGFGFVKTSPHHELAGIGLYSSNNRIFDNSFERSNVGIYLSSSSNNIIANNSFSYNQWHVRHDVLGSDNNSYINNSFIGTLSFRTTIIGSFNTFSGNLFMDCKEVTLGGENTTVINNRMESIRYSGDMKWKEEYAGLRLVGDDLLVNNNTFVNNDVGVKLYTCSLAQLIL